MAPAQLVAGAVCTLPRSVYVCAFWTRIKASAVVYFFCAVFRCRVIRASASKLEVFGFCAQVPRTVAFGGFALQTDSCDLRADGP